MSLCDLYSLMAISNLKYFHFQLSWRAGGSGCTASSARITACQSAARWTDTPWFLYFADFKKFCFLFLRISGKFLGWFSWHWERYIDWSFYFNKDCNIELEYFWIFRWEKSWWSWSWVQASQVPQLWRYRLPLPIPSTVLVDNLLMFAFRDSINDNYTVF